jgi:hypothetical protein
MGNGTPTKRSPTHRNIKLNLQKQILVNNYIECKKKPKQGGWM